jgi:hypothetical protein
MKVTKSIFIFFIIFTEVFYTQNDSLKYVNDIKELNKKEINVKDTTKVIKEIKEESDKSVISHKFISIGTKEKGISLGNSEVYEGIRINLIDKEVKKVKIFNLSLIRSNAEVSNGVSISFLINQDIKNNGISIAGIYNEGMIRNGLVLGGLIVYSEKFNGIGLAGIALAGDTLNGLFISGYGVSYMGQYCQIKLLNGIAIGGIGTSFKRVNGLTIGAINTSLEHYGLSIGIFNQTQKLKGIQIGLINYAANNPRFLRWLPLINLHFRDRKKD